MSTKLQQGQADGLCGIYAVMNFLRSKRASWKAEDPSQTLYYLLESCANFGCLTPRHLTSGFEDRELKAILDGEISNYRLSYATHFVDDVIATRKYSDFHDYVEAILAKGGAVIASHERHNHWLLLESRSGVHSVIDSNNRKKPIAEFSRRLKNFSSIEGIVIVPAKRPQIEIEL